MMTGGEAVTGPMANPPHPGELVRHDCLEPLNLTVTAGAKVLGVSRKTLDNLVKSPRVTGGTTRFWAQAVHRVAAEGISPEQAVDEAIARIEQILSESPTAAGEAGERQATTRMCAAGRERGFFLMTISTSRSSAVKNVMSRSTENPASL